MNINIKRKNICLVGLGPHAKRIYYKYISNEVKKNKAIFSLLIDVQDKKDDIDLFLSTEEVLPKKIVLGTDKNYLVPDKLDPLIEKELTLAIKEKKIQFAIVSTEPKAHKIYIDFFLKNHIPTLTDKPLTSPVGLNYDRKAASQVYKDAIEFKRISKKYKTPLYVQVQRREHPAYKFIFNECLKVVTKFKVPITYFDIYHSDGTWSMPEEFDTRENHPYKYGYGKIMHSGYHFIDIVSWIAKINKTLIKDLYIQNSTDLLTPSMQYKQLDGKNLYLKLFNKKTKTPSKNNLGEVDSYTNFKFMDSKKNIITSGRLDMLQGGFSKRAWFDLPKDTYKGNGRLRHERINLHIGPLLNIQLHSYQSDETGKTSIEGVGGEDHLEVFIFRNSKIIGGKSFEKIDFGLKLKNKHFKNDIYIGQNEVPRYTIFKKLINNKKSKTTIEHQMLTNKLISNMFLSFINSQTITIKI